MTVLLKFSKDGACFFDRAWFTDDRAFKIDDRICAYYNAAFTAIGWSILGHIGGSLRTADELVFFKTPYSYWAAFATVTVLLVIYVFAPTNVSPFIYFQF